MDPSKNKSDPKMADYISEFGHPFMDDTREKVGVIVYDRIGNLLMVEGKGGKISLPKGGRLRGETEYEGALREAWEETGIDLERLKYKEKIKLIWGTYFVYHLDGLGRNMQLRAQPGETLKVFWKDPKCLWLKFANVNCDLGHYIKSRRYH